MGCPAHNCGGRCLLVAHVKGGVITCLDADDRPDTLAAPQLRACVRGRVYLRRQYHPDRLKYPMKRVGQCGEGGFERISWDEALDTVAGEMERVFINEIDARARSIADGDEVRVYNERGVMVLPCRVTNRILPEVINIP